MIQYMKMLFPKQHVHPLVRRQIKAIEVGWWIKKREMINIIGSKDCLDPGVEVLLYSGAKKRAGDVVVGDALMGPDSTPRHVLSTCSGVSQMYCVTPKIGKPFKCTDNHLVTVICKIGRLNSNRKSWSSGFIPGKVYDVPASNLAGRNKAQMHLYGLQTATVEFPTKELPIDPYIYGLWLGDGAWKAPCITGIDDEVLSAWIDYFSGRGMRMVTHCDKRRPNVKTVYARAKKNFTKGKNWVTDFFRSSTNAESKFIREEYLTASAEQRMQLLAGIIDTDGTFDKVRHIIGCSDPLLMDGYERLANSLGFRTSRIKRSAGYIGVRGDEKMCEALGLSGDTWRVPVKLDRKRRMPPTAGDKRKKHGVSAFDVEPCGMGKYAGFTVDGDGRFLLGDCTVTHNSSKTNTMASIAIALLSLDPEMTVVFAATPFKNAAESTLWGRLGRRFQEMDKSIIESMWPNAKCVGERIVLAPGTFHSGYIELKVLDKVSSLQGAKAPDESGKRGFMLILCDEVALFKNTAFKETLDNLLGKQRLMILDGCNFRDTDGIEGDLCRPQGREYDALDLEEDQYWDSAYNSFTLRLDGHRSPNIRLGYTKYPYLLTERARKIAEDQHGLQGPKYLEQIRSFPSMSQGAMTVITRADLTAWGVYDDSVVWNERERPRVAFVDPAWGGDNAVFQAFEFGTAHVFTNDGKQVPMQIFTPVSHPETIKLKNNMVVDETWMARFQSAMRNRPYYRPIGNIVTLDQQIVVAVFELCLKHNVPIKNLGFDASLRGSIVQEFDAIIGNEVTAIDPLGVATERLATTRGEKASDLYCSFATEVWFAFGETARAGQVRGGVMLTTAVSQMCRRTYKMQGDKRRIENKDDFKKRMGSSPDHADVLCGGLEMARRRGFAIRGKRVPSETGGSGLLEHLQGLRVTGNKRIHRLSAAKL